MQVALIGLLVGLVALIALMAWAYRRDSKIAKERRSSVVLRRSFAKHNLMPSLEEAESARGRDDERAKGRNDDTPLTAAPPSRGFARDLYSPPRLLLYPPPLKPFIGQLKILIMLRRKLARRSTQMITLVSQEGLRGVGLSALAAHIYYSDGDKFFPDGKYWLDLRHGNAVSTLRHLLYALEVDGTTMPNDLPALCDAVHQQLADKRVLLVLDEADALGPKNAQKACPDEGRVKEIVEQICLPAPALTMIISRLPLYGKDDLVVPPFREADGLLFLRRKLAWKQAQVKAEQEDAKRLIQRAGGLPLALELTAQRMLLKESSEEEEAMPACAAVLEELDGAQPLLEALNLPVNDSAQETIIAQTFALSYQALPQPIKNVFHACGLCAPTGTCVAALAYMLEATAEELDVWLADLALYSLINYDRDQKRVRLHPLFHEYARLLAKQQRQEADQMLVRHARYFGQQLGGSYQRAIQEGSRQEVAQALAQIDYEEQNVRLAQERAYQGGFPEPQLAIDVTLALWLYWRLREEPYLVTWLTKMRKVARQRGRQQQACQLQKAIGDVYALRDNHNAAALAYKLAFSLYQQTGNLLGQANTQKAIGDIEAARQKEDVALSYYEQALTRFQQAGDKQGQANVNLALGRLTKQSKHFEQAITLYQQSQDTYATGQAQYLLALAHIEAGKQEQAEKLLQEARRAWAEVGFESGVESVEGLLSGEM